LFYDANSRNFISMEHKLYRRCLAGLDQSESDKYVVEYLSCLSAQIAIPNLTFAHVDQFKPEQQTQTEMPVRGSEGSDNPISTISNKCPDAQLINDIKVLNLQGHPETVLSKCVVQQDIDLICVGLKDASSRFAKVGRRLLCVTEADVLFIPPVESKVIKRILIPADLSEKSYDLVEKTRAQFPDAAIQIFFVNYIPPVTVMNKDDRDKLIATSSQNLDSSMSRFIETLSCNKKDITFGYAMSEHFNAGYAIYKHATEAEFDLLVVGRLSSLDKELPFLGSVTEKILSLSNELPVLVINH